MDINVIVQVAIGIIFVWIILAVITSQLQDWIASALSWRASMLEETIKHMLGDPNLKNRFYNHPLIKGLHTHDGKRKPGGIPEDKFALVLFEEVMNSGVSVTDVKDTFDKLKKNVTALKAMEAGTELKEFATSLDTLLIGIEDKAGEAADKINEARMRVEGWFNNSMERLGGAYRRRMQMVAIIVGIVVAAALNADTAFIASRLWSDPVLRETVVAQAGQLQQSGVENPNGQQPPSAEEIMKTAEQLSALPIGWSANNLPQDANGWASKIFGILLSGMAAAQGAPYWFDLMRKLVSRGK